MDNLHAPTTGSGPTSQPTSNGTSRKQSLQELISQKETLEAELSALGSVLQSHGVNMSTGLTTFDGYPRADIDVAQIRTTRARIIRLKNDHKALMERVEDAVHEHFAVGKGEGAESLPSRTAPTTGSADARTGVGAVQAPAPAVEPPFARVNSVVEGSPAAAAGLRAGDLVTRFGSAEWGNHERLGRVARVVQQSEGRGVEVRVLREGRRVEVEVRPRGGWGGRGLLGCHLVPI